MLATDIIEDDEKILKEKDIEYSLPKEAEGINQVAKNSSMKFRKQGIA